MVNEAFEIGCARWHLNAHHQVGEQKRSDITRGHVSQSWESVDDAADALWRQPHWERSETGSLCDLYYASARGDADIVASSGERRGQRHHRKHMTDVRATGKENPHRPMIAPYSLAFSMTARMSSP
jgi:hypothetical protein